MKLVFWVCMVLLVFFMWSSGVYADALTVPDLVGNWTGTSVGHYADKGYVDANTFEYTFVVTEQKDRVFNGTLLEEGINGHKEYPYSGIIGPDMKKLYIAEYGTGLDVGYLLSDTEMELILLVPEEKGLAELCVLTKVV